MRIMKKI